MDQKYLPKIFWGLLALLFIALLFMVPHYGISGDEVTQWRYGDFVWRYIKTFGADKAVLDDPYIAKNDLKYYGGFFDGVAAMLIDIFKPKDQFLLRHYWNMVFGFVGIVFGGLIAKQLVGWRAAILTVLFMVFTPRFFGELANNPKDIPFTTGYLIAIYCIIIWLKDLPRISWGKTLLLGLAIALAISTRVGGILVIAYWGLFYILQMVKIKGFQDGTFLKSLKYIIVALVIGWVGACLWWPFALEDMINNPIESVKVMSAYPLNITTLFDGQKIRTTEIPLSYLPTWMAIGTPIFILLGWLGSWFFLRKWSRQYNTLFFYLIAFAMLFPVLYILYKKSVLYDGMRHIMFVLPLMAMMAAFFFDQLFRTFKDKKGIQYAITGILVVLMALPARFMFASHPNEYIYFNELAGGIKGAYGKYETDYYFNSMKEAFQWLVDHKLKDARPSAGNDSVIVASNAPALMEQYQKISPVPFKFVYVRYYQRAETDWDYGIFMSRFLDREQLQSGYFPGDAPIYVVKADGVPLTTVLQNDPERNAFKGNEALNQGRNEEAISYLQKAVRQYPLDVESWRNLSIAEFQSGKVQESLEAIGKAYGISSLDMNIAHTAGMLHLQAGDANGALKIYGKMTEDYPQAAEGWLGLGQAQAANKNFNLAIENINKSMVLNAQIAPQAYMALAYIYQQMGDMATAQKYASEAQKMQQR